MEEKSNNLPIEVKIETIKGTKNELITHLELQPRGGFVAVIK